MNDTERELRECRELVALLTERLERLQRDNEGAYIEAFEARGSGPHLCPGLPFGDPRRVAA
ncbi:hypothetical protein ACFYM2_21415 [Streptomyces sp. NPDC006711]|uniref:hypothetical protein n=1 Tax=Streptomyces sp. NPDC006711 TaxID=3364762 RepID=UPI00368A9FD4